MNKDSKIYVAGHRGLVGSAIVGNLKAKGYTNLVFRTHSELDLKDQAQVADLFSAEKPEYVILAAAKVGGIIANAVYRGQFIYENLMIQNNVIHQSYVHGVKKLLFLGSTCIYPKMAPQPMKENSLLTDELEYSNEPYAIAKIAGIKLCDSYNIQYGTNFISVMPTNLYGPNDNFDLEKSHVLPALVRKNHLGKCLLNNDWDKIKADLNRKPIEGIDGGAGEEAILKILAKYGIIKEGDSVQIEIWGTGKPFREFLWSEDMADACVYLMEKVDFTDIVKARFDADSTAMTNKELLEKEVRNTHFNIGTGIEISIRELAEKIKETVGFKGELFFNASRPDGTPRKLTDPSLLHSAGWRHKVELEEGIQKIYNWYLQTS